MTLRRGFTLIEVMIALLIGSVVVLLAYATLRAGLDVQARVVASREADASAAAMRAMLGDALRHAMTGDGRETRGLQTEVDAAGTVRRLAFVSRGITSPHGGSAPWRVDLRSDTAGLTFSAVSVDSARAPLRFTSRAATAFAVRFLVRDDAAWRDEWNDPTRLPGMIEVRFLDGRGQEALPTLLARTSPVSGL